LAGGNGAHRRGKGFPGHGVRDRFSHERERFCMDLPEIGRRFKGRITFWGEIDRQRVLPLRTRRWRGRRRYNF
jgi:hypothetical protein